MRTVYQTATELSEDLQKEHNIQYVPFVANYILTKRICQFTDQF